MADCDAIYLSELVAGWLTLLETEAVNELKDARAFSKVSPEQFAVNRVKYAEYKLAAIRQARQRIPKAWHKATVNQE